MTIATPAVSLPHICSIPQLGPGKPRLVSLGRNLILLSGVGFLSPAQARGADIRRDGYCVRAGNSCKEVQTRSGRPILGPGYCHRAHVFQQEGMKPLGRLLGSTVPGHASTPPLRTTRRDCDVCGPHVNSCLVIGNPHEDWAVVSRLVVSSSIGCGYAGLRQRRCHVLFASNPIPPK